MTDSKTKTNTDEETKKTIAPDTAWATEKKKRRRKPRKKTSIDQKTWATEKQVIQELTTPESKEKETKQEEAWTNEPEHSVAGIDDLHAYIASKKNVTPEKTIPTSNDLLAADETNLLTVPGIFAVVPHAKGDHKLVFKKDQMPEWLLDDPKNRIPWTLYKKNWAAIYLVNLIMKEHPTLRDARGNNYDVWIIDDEKQLNEQLQSIKNGMWWGENFGSPLLAWKDLPSTTTASEVTAASETKSPEAPKGWEEAINEVTPVDETIEKESNPDEAVNKTEAATTPDENLNNESWNDQQTDNTDETVSTISPEPETETASAPEVITQEETIPQSEDTDVSAHHPFTHDKETQDVWTAAETVVAAANSFNLPEINIPDEPTIDMDALEKIDDTLSWDTDSINLNFHDSITEPTTEEKPEDTATPAEQSEVTADITQEETPWVDLTLTENADEAATTPEDQETTLTPPEETVQETDAPPSDLPDNTLTEATEQVHTETNSEEAWWSHFTPIAVEEAATQINDAEFNLDDLSIDEAVSETPQTVSTEQESTTMPTGEEIAWETVHDETATPQSQTTIAETTINTTTPAQATKKWIPTATKLRLVWFVLIVFCLGIIAFVMFPKNQWEKNSDDTWLVESDVENTLDNEIPLDDLNANENQGNPWDDAEYGNENPTEEVVPDDTFWPEDNEQITPPDDESDNPTPSGSLMINELKIKLEAQQADARKMLNVAKLIDNKAAIKFSLAANLKAGNVLERIDTDSTITADDVASEVETIDRYLEEASKLVE